MKTKTDSISFYSVEYPEHIDSRTLKDLQTAMLRKYKTTKCVWRAPKAEIVNVENYGSFGYVYVREKPRSRKIETITFHCETIVFE